MKTYRIVLIYSSKFSAQVYSNNDPEVCFDVFKHLCDEHADDSNYQFRCQVLFGGQYHTIEI